MNFLKLTALVVLILTLWLMASQPVVFYITIEQDEYRPVPEQWILEC